jgi:DNA helicase-2/ATP-dependent DNA helicase PcrA
VLDGLTDAQRDAVTHRGSPLLVVAGPGTGKTHVLARRFRWLVQEQGRQPEQIVVLAPGEHGAGDLRERIELELAGRPYEELVVHGVRALCARLLAEEAAIDPFAPLASPADRVAMLLERVDELELRHHDFRGRPATLAARFVRRIDRCKSELIDAARYGAWAAGLPDDEHGRREREFAAVFRAHDRMLAERAALDSGDLLGAAVRVLEAGPSRRPKEILVDDWQDLSFGEREVIAGLERTGAQLTAAADDDQAVVRRRSGGGGALLRFVEQRPGAAMISLGRSFRCPQRVLDAAHAIVAPNEDRMGKDLQAAAGAGRVSFWRTVNERSQAQSVAAELERLIVREGVAPERIAVLVRSVDDEGHAVGVALEERAVPFRVIGADAFYERAEIRDVLAWLRLLADPRDATAVVRALARPPIELHSVDIARCVQIARRRKLDMVSALVAAIESPQVPPEARERIHGFLALQRSAAGALDSARPDVFVHRLIDRLGLRRHQLFSAQADVVERLVNLAKLGELASAYARGVPQATAREFARYAAAVADAGIGEEEAVVATRPSAVSVMSMRTAQGMEFDHVFVLGLHSARMPGARGEPREPLADELLHEQLPADSAAGHAAAMRRLLYVAATRARVSLVLAYAASSQRAALQQPSPFVEHARAALGASWEQREEELFGPAEALHSTFSALRDELLDSVARIGGRLGELRLDTDLDISHGVVRFLELVKIAALLERSGEEPMDEALADVNARLAQAVTPLQREVLSSSPLDDLLLGAERDAARRVQASTARAEPSLEAFLPRRGEGLMLSASDIETYRTCPLKYKFARVLRIPQEPTLNQRFGIAVHQVLERYHAAGASTCEELLELLDAAWRRGGFADSDEERQLREKAGAALVRYHERLSSGEGEPRWFERSFTFALGPHQIRGRVDRVDELPGGGYELIDYKTGVPKAPSQLREDIQLALYAVAAREAWNVDARERSYYYVLDDRKVPVPHDGTRPEWISETVMDVGEGILAQGFEPSPSYSACSICDYRIACPAAEK